MQKISSRIITIMMATMVAFTFMPNNADAAAVKQVKGLKLTNTHNTITAKWKKVNGATKYLVQIARPYNAWNKVKQVKNTKANRKKFNVKGEFKTEKVGKKKLQVYKWCKGKTWYIAKNAKFKFKNLKKNMNYTVKVRAYRGKKKGAFSAEVVRKTFVKLKKANPTKSITVDPGKTKKIKITKNPTNTTQTVTYKSNDTSVATVSANGTVKGQSPGTTTVTVKPTNETTTVTVEDPVYKDLVERIFDWNETNPKGYSIIPYNDINFEAYDDPEEIKRGFRNLNIIKQAYPEIENKSDRYKAVAVAEWLCDRLTYNRTVYSALFDTTETNCGGYAAFYQFYLHHLGVECYDIGLVDSNHAMNIVKIDGKYYYVDLVCLDDDGVKSKAFRPDNRARLQYFVTSANTFSTSSPGWSGGEVLPSDNPINPTDTTYDNYTGADWYNILQRGN